MNRYHLRRGGVGHNWRFGAAGLCSEFPLRGFSFHDDQHGTAVVSLAALFGAAEVVGKRLEDLRVVFLGMSAAGVACVKLWQHAGVGHFIGVDRHGIISMDRTDLNSEKRSIAETTNAGGLRGGLREALVRADVFVGVSLPGLVKPYWVATMARNADYANQINNVLVFPGMFRGLVDSRARSVDMSMKVAAAHAIADIVAEDGATTDHIPPSIFDARVVPTVAGAVQKAAALAGLGTLSLPTRVALG